MHRPLTEIDLFPNGPLHRIGSTVITLSDVDSTNSYLMSHAQEYGDGTVVNAEFQAAGRGRHGRRWVAPRGSSILLSVLLFEREGSWRATYASMIGALAAAEAIDAETDCQPALSWPNDLVADGRKLGGVLAESTRLQSSPRAVPPLRALVIDIGLNCLQQPSHFDSELTQTATSLEIECQHPVDRPAIARRIVERLDALLADGVGDDPTGSWVREAWTARCEDLGARVTLDESSRRYTGTVLDITDNGDLVVQLDDGGRRRFESATTTRIR